MHQIAISNFKQNKCVDTLKSYILNQIKEYGYIVINEKCSMFLFNELSRNLGEVIMENDIKINPDGKFAAFRSGEVLPHTDSVDAHIIAWYCIDQDQYVGESQLTHIGDLRQYFNTEEINFLKVFKANLKSEKDKTSSAIKGLSDTPLVTERWNKLKVNYAPWLEFCHKDPIKDRVLKKFQRYMEKRIENNTTSYRLKRDEILFIDNGQVLHSRKEISDNSKRCLRRLWIKTK